MERSTPERWIGSGLAGLLVAVPTLLCWTAAPSAGQEAVLGGAEVESRPVTLDEAVSTALDRSPALEQARAGLRATRSQETSAFGRYLPSVSLGYGFSRASTGRLDQTGQAITTQSYTGQLRGNITLFDGFRRRNDLATARDRTRAEEATYERSEFDAILGVKTAFFDAVAARERIEVERDRVERQQEQLEFVREQVRLGRATRSDSLRSRVDLNNARLALLEAENSARSAEFALGEAMGVEERVRPVEEASLDPTPVPVEREQLIRFAVDRAPSVRSAARSVSAAESGVAAARSSYWPSLQLSGGLDWRNEDFPPDDRSWSFSLSGSVPLFNGLQRESGIDRARAQALQARARRRSAELAVRSDIQAAYDQVRTAEAGLELADESVEAAEEDLRVTEQRFRAGVATTLDLRSAQIALQQAEVDRIRRRFDFQVGIARIESLLGAEMDEVARWAAESSDEGDSFEIGATR